MVTVTTSASASPALSLSRSNSEPAASSSSSVSKCPRCEKEVRADEAHAEVLTYVVQSAQWHADCAVCVSCSAAITTRETSQQDDGNASQVYCQPCYRQHSSKSQLPFLSASASRSSSAALSFAGLLRLLGSLWSTLLYAVSLPFLLCQTLYYDVFLGQILLYNISFEDARIDRQILAVKGKTLLTLTSAGDNALDALTEGAAKVIAIDQNVAQSSLMELKLCCIRQLSYDQFWQIFGQCNGAVFRSVYQPLLRPHLSAQAQAFWDSRQYYMDGFYYRGGSGVCGWLLVRVFCPLTGLRGMLEELKAAPSLEQQRDVYLRWRPYFHRVMRVLYWLGAWKFLAWLVAVPTSQQSLLSTNWEHYIESVLDHVCCRTHLSGENHYYSIYMTGRYTANNCPRYLQKRWFSFLKQNVHRVELRCGSLFDVMRELAARQQKVDRFNLLDHMDWMDEQTVLREWQLISQLASADALAIWKSISEISSPTVLGFLPTPPEAQEKIDAFMLVDCTPTYRSIRLARVPTAEQMVFAPRNVPAVVNASFSNDLKVLYAMYVMPFMRKLGLASRSASVLPASSVSAAAAGSPAESASRSSMNAFYAPQAALYDSYRHRMLHGRSLMAACLPIKKDGVWVDVGGGTAFNLEYCADVISAFQRVYVVDVCDHLLLQAERRVRANGWSNVTCIQRDVCQAGILTAEEAAQGCDLVTFSYSLTMIPQWREALQAAYDMLRPGGIIAITDFTVLPARFQSPLTRRLLTSAFAIDGVKLSEQHRQQLVEMFVPCVNEVRYGGFPYVPLLRCPFYVFIGRKPDSAGRLIWKGSPVSKKTGLTKRSMSGLMLADASLSR